MVGLLSLAVLTPQLIVRVGICEDSMWQNLFQNQTMFGFLTYTKFFDMAQSKNIPFSVIVDVGSSIRVCAINIEGLSHYKDQIDKTLKIVWLYRLGNGKSVLINDKFIGITDKVWILGVAYPVFRVEKYITIKN